jgi:hypothetical protein
MSKFLFIISQGFEKAGRATRAFQFAKVARENGGNRQPRLVKGPGRRGTIFR